MVLDVFILISLKFKEFDDLIEGLYEPKWVNPVLNLIGVNSLRLGGFHLKAGNGVSIYS